MARLTARLAAPALALAAVAAVAPPASAHGTCKATAAAPAPALLAVAYSGAYDCTEPHDNLYVTACLERSLTSPTSGYQVIHCTTAHATNANHVHAVGSASDTCLVGYYRVYAYGRNGNLAHQNLDYSPPVACLSA